jgi:hypothetical protein
LEQLACLVVRLLPRWALLGVRWYLLLAALLAARMQGKIGVYNFLGQLGFRMPWT